MDNKWYLGVGSIVVGIVLIYMFIRFVAHGTYLIDPVLN